MIKLIAVGCRFMRDDGIAVKAAERLRESLTGPETEILIAETDCQSCFYSLNEDDFIIILDAMHTETETGAKIPPGTVRVFDLAEVIAQPFDFFTQHDMGIIELMKLHGSKFNGRFIGIETADIGFDDKLSPALTEKFDLICSEVENAVKKIIVGCHTSNPGVFNKMNKTQ